MRGAGPLERRREARQRAPALGEPPDEAALIAAARRDPRAFEPLYTAYVDAVHRYAYRRLGDRDEAAEATQEVFARALRALPRYRDEAFRPWLFAIARNAITDLQRRRGLHPPDAPLDAADDHPDPAPTPEDVALVAEARRSIHGCLARLTPDQRAVVELRLADLSGQEVAEILGRSVGSVKVAQHRAYARLRLLLTSETIEEDRHGSR